MSRTGQAHKPHLRRQIAGPAAAPVADFSAVRVLVVENHALMRRLLREMLRGFGVGLDGIVEARDVPQARAAVFVETFDIIILDFFLGDFDGGDFARWLRQSSRSANSTTPILMITAQPDHYKVTKARDSGINAVLAKPIIPRDLYLRMSQMMLRRPRTPALAALAERAEPSSGLAPAKRTRPRQAEDDLEGFLFV